MKALEKLVHCSTAYVWAGSNHDKHENTTIYATEALTKKLLKMEEVQFCLMIL